MSSDKPVEILFSKSVTADSSYASGIAYAITTTIDVNSEYTGSIPFEDTQVFLFRSSDQAFVRICNIADLDLYPKTLNSNSEYYRNNSFTAKYQDLAVAIAAMPVIRDRVSALISSRLDLLGQFSGVISPIDLPYTSTSESSKEAYKTAYTDARDARSSLDADINASNTSYSIAKEKELAFKRVVEWLTDLVPKLKKASESIDDITNLYTWLGSNLTGSVVSFKAAVDALNNGDTLTKEEVSLALAGIIASIDTLTTQSKLGPYWRVVTGDADVSLKSYLDLLYYTYAAVSQASDAQLTALKNVSATKLSELKEKESVLLEAAAAEQAALANISRYCPDIDITSLA
jgi:hypothetical protein